MHPAQHPGAPGSDLGVLRFLTCGNVDDGKSTLIGRLLFDTRSLAIDTVASLEANASRRGLSAPDLALLTDGLVAEREQGITIDVAYRYFATARRKFIIADAPGHEEYTRNMVTAASTADLAVLLVDARRGISDQTRRHATLASLLGVRQLVLAVNKMDLVDWSQPVFDRIVGEFTEWLANHEAVRPVEVAAIPLSALEGDNVVQRSPRLPWYDGPTLVELLEAAPSAVQHDVEAPLRFPVQWVCRQGQGDFGYAGRVEAGVIRTGDPIVILPGARSASVTRISLGETRLPHAVAGQSVLLSLDRELDISRGDLIVHPPSAPDDGPPARLRIESTLCWMADMPLQPARTYLLRHAMREVRARIDAIESVLDVRRARWHGHGELRVATNDIARVRLVAQQPVFADRYRDQRATGAFILIDESTQATVAAGMIE